MRARSRGPARRSRLREAAAERVPDPAPSKPTGTAPAPGERGPGWRVEPAPDGRGTPPEAKPPMRSWARRWLPFFVGLLALNLVLSFATGGPVKRTQVPYQPFFVDQLGFAVAFVLYWTLMRGTPVVDLDGVPGN